MTSVWIDVIGDWIQRPGRGGQETWNLCGLWRPSFLWLICTGLGGGMGPSAPPGSATGLILEGNEKRIMWESLNRTTIFQQKRLPRQIKEENYRKWYGLLPLKRVAISQQFEIKKRELTPIPKKGFHFASIRLHVYDPELHDSLLYFLTGSEVRIHTWILPVLTLKLWSKR